MGYLFGYNPFADLRLRITHHVAHIGAGWFDRWPEPGAASTSPHFRRGNRLGIGDRQCRRHFNRRLVDRRRRISFRTVLEVRLPLRLGDRSRCGLSRAIIFNHRNTRLRHRPFDVTSHDCCPPQRSRPSAPTDSSRWTNRPGTTCPRHPRLTNARPNELRPLTMQRIDSARDIRHEATRTVQRHVVTERTQDRRLLPPRRQSLDELRAARSRRLSRHAHRRGIHLTPSADRTLRRLRDLRRIRVLRRPTTPTYPPHDPSPTRFRRAR